MYCVSVACRRGDELLVAVIEDPEGENLFTAVRGGGATWNGRPMEVSGQGGLKGAFLATGYPWRALPTLDLYLGIFRDVFRVSKAIRRCGSAALDLAYTAAGVYDGFFEFRLSPWDIGAGILLVREAGGDRHRRRRRRALLRRRQHRGRRAGRPPRAARHRRAPRQRGGDRAAQSPGRGA